MELEEMKNTWNLLNRRLDEDKLLKESLIREMIQRKADKVVNKLINYDIFSVVTLLLLYTINGLLLFPVWRKICNMGYLYNLWNPNMFIRDCLVCV